jgi:predicted dehydrogenase
LKHISFLSKFKNVDFDTLYYRHNKDTAKGIAEEYRFKRISSQFPTQTDNGDLVFVSSYPGFHYEHVKAAIKANMNVVVDKPFVSSLAEASELAQLASSKHLHTFIFFQWRYHPGILALREKIRRETSLSISIDFFHSFMLSKNAGSTWRSDKSLALLGAFADLGIHCIDIAEYIIGGPLEYSSCSLKQKYNFRSKKGKKYPCDTEDSGNLVLKSSTSDYIHIAATRVSDTKLLYITVMNDRDKRFLALNPDTGAILMNNIGLKEYVPRRWEECIYADIIQSVEGTIQSTKLPAFKDSLSSQKIFQQLTNLGG